MAKKRARRVNSTTSYKRPSMGLAITALIINIFVPGLGSLIGGKIRTGTKQLIMWAIGWILIALALWIIGAPLAIAALIWGIVTGAQLIQEAR